MLSPARVSFAIKEGDLKFEMNDNEPVTSVNKSEKTVVDNRGRANVTPHFDSLAVERARPAVPISNVHSGRTWLTTLIIAAVLAGLGGGVIGSLLTTKFLGREAAQAPAPTAVRENGPVPSAPRADVPSTIERGAEAAAAPVPETAAGPEKEIVETVKGQSPAVTEDVRPNEPPGDQEKALRAALDEWVAATNARDLGRQMTFYGPVVNAFYRERNAPLELVRADKERAFRNADSIAVRVGAPQINVAADGRSATMRFHKSYTIAGGGEDRSGEVVQELRWRLVGGKWRIVSERDIKVVR
jgi:ketosteroid isomerase-like protein